MPQIRFVTAGGGEQALFAASGENLLSVAQKGNVAIDAPCSGNGSCGKCRVRLVSGALDCAKSQHIRDEDYQNGWRLSCQSTVIGDAVIEVPDIAAAYRSRMKVADLSDERELTIFFQLREELLAAGLSFGPAIHAMTLALDPPSMDDPRPDNSRLIDALKKEYGLTEVTLPMPCLKKLPGLLRGNGFSIRCVIRVYGSHAEVLDLMAADDRSPICGLAVDIGTTSVAALLVDLSDGAILAKASAGNGQIRYGADVINRIMQQQKDGGVLKLQDAIIDETLRPLILELCHAAKLPHACIYQAYIVGNTTMQHLALGIDANGLRTEPYVPAFFSLSPLRAQSLGLSLHPAAKLDWAPNIGSYVGGDITAGTLVSQIWNSDALCLFIDLGTNGELVFGNRDFLMSCACSAGPAFEGGDISCGMRAIDGAIESCTIDPLSLEPQYSVIGGGRPVGLCGSGIIDLIAALFRRGIINARGAFERESARVKIDTDGMGRYILCFQEDSDTGREIAITSVDIDNFIRAKGAIFSAIQTMLASLDMDAGAIGRVLVAGGIGSGINIQNAIQIGMFPDIPLENYAYIGNAALSGAYAAIVSQKASDKLKEVAANMTYLELSAIPSYMDAFVAACFLPHTDAALFPSLNKENAV